MKQPTLRTALALIIVSATAFVLADAASGLANTRELTFEERVKAQQAIEQVYWNHRIWPDQNHRAKPSLGEVLPESALRAKVSDYLCLSDDLASRGNPISEQQLHEEMNRMVAESKAPEVLRELFAALGDDLFVIGETLVRQKLVARLAADPSDETQHLIADGLESIGRATIATASTTQALSAAMAASCQPDTWTPTSTSAGVLPSRDEASAVWTGTEMIVWGGHTSSGRVNTGARYDPATDSWTPTSTTGAPAARTSHSAIWTGSEMVVWGGIDPFGVQDNTGGRYNPTTDMWIPTATTGAPQKRYFHTAVWTGTEMIVWGGVVLGGVPTDTGGRFNPATDMWVPTVTTGAPQMRYSHTVVWTGTEMVVWSGRVAPSLNVSNTGGRYNPATDTWAPTSTTGAPAARASYSTIWTGTEMVVWGGLFADFPTNTGGRYNPAADMWVPTATADAPQVRSGHTAVWTGSGMIVWGGEINSGALNTGGRYSPVTDHWTSITTAGAPSARGGHAAVWTGTEMIIWGRSGVNSDTGGRFCPDCDDGNPCTSDRYDSSVGCVHAPIPDGPCCLNGQPVNCDDASLCTIDACNPASGCSHTPANCDDGTTCTVDSCDPATGCVNTLEAPGTLCDDGNLCTAVDACDATGHCIPGPRRDCDDGNACSFDVCNPSQGTCEHLPYSCNDGINCTGDYCDPTTGCYHVPHDVDCGDTNPCNGVETCDPHRGCVHGAPLNCDDGNCCTIDACNPAYGCYHTSTHPVFTTQPQIGDGCELLWPPEHGYIDITVAQTGAAVASQCGVASVAFESCSSSQPENGVGTGDGNSTRDCVYSAGTLSLRVERDGACSPTGRVYTSSLIATDSCGNSTVSNPFTVFVWPTRGHAPSHAFDSAGPGSDTNDTRAGVNGTYGTDCGPGIPAECNLGDETPDRSDADPEMEITQQASVSVADLHLDKTSDGNVELTWTEPAHELTINVTRFHVYRFNPATLWWTQIAEVTRQTNTYLDPVLDDGSSWQYKVTAVIK